ncbi:hypothetical protein OIV83_001968 [Microbotryomycetes sp. JL201]|nr:hypothetical protein OIV83_001968 [Microbotryomycetes sp. JL201]
MHHHHPQQSQQGHQSRLSLSARGSHLMPSSSGSGGAAVAPGGYTSIPVGDDERRRRSSILHVLATRSVNRSRPTRCMLLGLSVVCVVLLCSYATPDATRDHLSTLSRESLQRFQDSAAAAAYAAKNAVNWRETDLSSRPGGVTGANQLGTDTMDGDELQQHAQKPPPRPWGDAAPHRQHETPLEEEGYLAAHSQYPAPSETPLEGFGALSRLDNPWRERFLVPLYACNEQETGSQMHVRQLLHLAKTLNRTLVLPNWGFGIPTISNCRPYGFDQIYETESTNSVGLWSIPFRKWKEWINSMKKAQPFSARISVIFFRNTHKVLSESISDTDEGILKEMCVPHEPFKIDDPPLYVATTPATYLSSIVDHLRETDHLSTLFVIFNHYSDLRLKGDVQFPDPLLQQRPKEWGLWVGSPWPQWNYSTGVMDMFEAAKAKLPREYAAMQWRMELMPPKVLQDCADKFAESIISGMREKSLTTIYVASDMPLTHERAKSKSASFNLPEVQQARESIDHLVYRLNEANFDVRTWNDIKPADDDEMAIEGLADGASGIFDKLILGASTHLWGANPYCGFRSSFLGSIQTLRQDRIGDPSETDWDKLDMTWVGEPIKERFWWHVKGNQL